MVITMSPAKMAELIQMPCGSADLCGPKKPLLDEVPYIWAPPDKWWSIVFGGNARCCFHYCSNLLLLWWAKKRRKKGRWARCKAPVCILRAKLLVINVIRPCCRQSIGAAYCYVLTQHGGLCLVCWWRLWALQNGSTGWDAIWDVYSFGPKKEYLIRV